jgi:hypothetical protein
MWCFFFGFFPTYVVRKFLFFRRGKSNGCLTLMQKRKKRRKKKPFDYSFLKEGKAEWPHNSLYYDDL